MENMSSTGISFITFFPIYGSLLLFHLGVEQEWEGWSWRPRDNFSMTTTPLKAPSGRLVGSTNGGRGKLQTQGQLGRQRSLWAQHFPSLVTLSPQPYLVPLPPVTPLLSPYSSALWPALLLLSPASVHHLVCLAAFSLPPSCGSSSSRSGLRPLPFLLCSAQNEALHVHIAQSQGT